MAERITNLYDCRFIHLGPRFDPVSVHCILPGRGVLTSKEGVRTAIGQNDTHQYKVPP